MEESAWVKEVVACSVKATLRTSVDRRLATASLASAIAGAASASAS